jgi:hypothetical protein
MERIIYHSDMGGGTSDNRFSECSNIRVIYGEKVLQGFGSPIP